MRLYVDTSALLRRYFDEEESEAAVAVLAQGHAMMVSALVFTELASVFRRGQRSRRISPAQLRQLQEAARKDLRHFRVLGAGEELFRQAALIADQTGLKTLDCIHLASARSGGAEAILTYDREMAAAAARMGFKALS